MKYEFNLNNEIIKLCFKAMEQEGIKRDKLLNSAWEKVTNDFERFIAAYYISKNKSDNISKLEWLQKVLQYALNIDDIVVKSSLSSLYLNIAQCYDELEQKDKAEENYKLSELYKTDIQDKGPFYHGTRADLKVGDMLVAGKASNYQPEIIMNHIYFTAQINGAGFAADLARGKGNSRVYIVEPTGKFENDPNVTDVKFPGNPTRSYRSTESLKIVGEIKEWNHLSEEQIKQWHERIANNKGEIIN